MKRLIVGISIMLTVGIGLALTLLCFLDASSCVVAASPDCNPRPASGNVITVCLHGGCPFDNIQAAVDAASTNDQVLVAAGTFTGVHARSGVIQVLYISKTLVVQGGYSPDFSAWDPDVYPTVLDAQSLGRVIYIAQDVSPTLSGLSVACGSAQAGGGGSAAGGGIYAVNAHPMVSDCRIYSNTADAGGGLYFYGSDNVRLIRSQIYANTAGNATGGGVYFYSSNNVALNDNAIYNNRGRSVGGIYLSNGKNNSLSGNEIYGNVATVWSGGGILLSAVDAITLTGNSVYSNTANDNGGGLFIGNGVNVMLQNNRFYSNTTNDDGGGVYIRDSGTVFFDRTMVRWNTSVNGEGSGLAIVRSSPILTNTVVADNVDQGAGLGLRTAIYIAGASPRFLHLTLARHQGDGLYIGSDGAITSHVYLTNTIVYSHDFGVVIYSPLPDVNRVDLSTTLSYSNTILFKPFNNSAINHSGTQDGDPVFLADGYHISPDSAALNQGTAVDVVADIDGQARPAGAGYDIGADEFWFQVYAPVVLRQSP